jgi:hypothetical protein
LPAEQAAEYEIFTGCLVADLHPVGAMEEQLARSIADTHWRLNRAAVIENNIFASESWTSENDIDRARSQMRSFVEDPERFQLLTTYELRLQRKARTDLQQLRDLQFARVNTPQPAELRLPPPALAIICTGVAPPPSESPALNLKNGFVYSDEYFEARMAQLLNPNPLPNRDQEAPSGISRQTAKNGVGDAA